MQQNVKRVLDNLFTYLNHEEHSEDNYTLFKACPRFIDKRFKKRNYLELYVKICRFGVRIQWRDDYGRMKSTFAYVDDPIVFDY